MTAGGPVSRIIVNGLSSRVPISAIIEERREGFAAYVKRLSRRFGPLRAGSAALVAALARMPSARSQARIERIIAAYGLDPARRLAIPIFSVNSVNGSDARDILRELAPDVVVVCGARLPETATLRAAPSLFINYEPGMAPKYKGENPAYWALAEGDPANAGIGVSVVDGETLEPPVLYQSPCQFSPDDTIKTYAYLQAAHAIPLLARAIQDALDGDIRPRTVTTPARQCPPPTLSRYIWNGLVRGVW